MEIKTQQPMGEIIKKFSCGGRVWHIRTIDSPKLPQDKSLVFTVDECPEVTIYQQKGGLKRFYIKKVELSANQK